MEEVRREHLEEQHRGLTEAEIEALPVRVYHREDEGGVQGVGLGEELEVEREAEICTICLEEFAEGRSVVKTMKCGHFWHSACIEQWLRQGPTHCPLCLQRYDQAQNLAKRAPHHLQEGGGDGDGEPQG